MTLPPPTYMSQQVYDRLLGEGRHVGRIIQTVTYEEGAGGAIRSVAGYLLTLDGEQTGINTPFLALAPIRYLEGHSGGPRLNSGSQVTRLLIHVDRIITMKGEGNGS